MTAPETTDPAADLNAVVRSFADALPTAAKRNLHHDQQVDAWIYTAITSGAYTPAQLAKYVAGTDHGLCCTPGRIRWRLAKAAGATTEPEDNA